MRLRRVRDAHQVRQLIGLTGQYASMDEGLSGTNNLIMIGRLLGLPRAEARSRAPELLAASSDRRRRAAGKTYSGGMRGHGPRAGRARVTILLTTQYLDEADQLASRSSRLCSAATCLRRRPRCPAGCRPSSKVNPITLLAEAERGLFTGGGVATPAVQVAAVGTRHLRRVRPAGRPRLPSPDLARCSWGGAGAVRCPWMWQRIGKSH